MATTGKRATLILAVFLLAPGWPGLILAESVPPALPGATTPGFEGDPRGVERCERLPVRPWHPLLKAAFWVPSHVLDGLFAGSERAAGTFADPAFIARAEDFFYLVDRRLGWYPRLQLASGITPLFGAALFYRGDHAAGSASGAFHSDQTWELGGELSRRWERGGTGWTAGLAGALHRDDDLVFYGIGAAPARDPRSAFLPTPASDHGTYRQRRRHLRLALGMEPRPAWELTLVAYYETRLVRDLQGEADALGISFDLDRLAGARGESRQLHSEVDVVYDTRSTRGRIVPGARAAGYLGQSVGVSGDGSDRWLGGVDVAFFVPVIGRTRLLVPRLVFDGVARRREAEPLAFTEYPRHPLFRGVSSRTLLRSDEASLLSSLEYQWPVTPFVDGHLFADHLMVADGVGAFAPGDGLWAAGLGLDLHSATGIIAGLQLATGSQGIRFLLTAGFSGDSDSRFDQR